jgi:hypothetical protein
MTLTVTLIEGRCELGFRYVRLHEHETGRAAVGGGRAPFDLRVDGLQQDIRHRRIAPDIVRACVAEQLIERGIVESGIHGFSKKKRLRQPARRND